MALGNLGENATISKDRLPPDGVRLRFFIEDVKGVVAVSAISESGYQLRKIAGDGISEGRAAKVGSGSIFDRGVS